MQFMIFLSLLKNSKEWGLDWQAPSSKLPWVCGDGCCSGSPISQPCTQQGTADPFSLLRTFSQFHAMLHSSFLIWEIWLDGECWRTEQRLVAEMLFPPLAESQVWAELPAAWGTSPNLTPVLMLSASLCHCRGLCYRKPGLLLTFSSVIFTTDTQIFTTRRFYDVTVTAKCPSDSYKQQQSAQACLSEIRTVAREDALNPRATQLLKKSVSGPNWKTAEVIPSQSSFLLPPNHQSRSKAEAHKRRCCH